MSNLLYPRSALLVYVIGLVLTVIFNVFNGRAGGQQPRTDLNKTIWSGVLSLRELLLYPSIIILTYWAMQTNGYFTGSWRALEL